MANYRRNCVEGGTYFLTVVTLNRRPTFTEPVARTCLRKSILRIRAKRPFTIDAIVLLPDHFHLVWTLPPGDANYSLRIGQIKEAFTRLYLKNGGVEPEGRRLRWSKRERNIWQPRFWEYTCRDEDDMSCCIDYVHYNPKKHGLVRSVRDWPYSSFHRYVRLGIYDTTWGGVEPEPAVRGAEWDAVG